MAEWNLIACQLRVVGWGRKQRPKAPQNRGAVTVRGGVAAVRRGATGVAF